MNLSNIRTFASYFVGDPNLTRFTQAQYNDAINIAQQQFALDSKALFKDQSYTVSGGDSAKDLPSDFMFEKRVTYKGKPLDPMSRTTLHSHISKDDDWTDDTGTPKFYVIDIEEARKQIRLVPYPPSGDAGGTLVLTYYPLPATLSSDSSEPLNASALLAQFHINLAQFAAWLLLGYEEQTPGVLQKRSGLLSDYKDGVSAAVDTAKNTTAEPLRMRVQR